MARIYDHFHAKWEKDEESGEIEGGWTGYPNDFDQMTQEKQNEWLYNLCINWGMPEGAELRQIWLAG